MCWVLYSSPAAKTRWIPSLSVAEEVKKTRANQAVNSWHPEKGRGVCDSLSLFLSHMKQLLIMLSLLQGPSQHPDTLFQEGDKSFYDQSYEKAIPRYLLASEGYLQANDSIKYSNAINDTGLCYYLMGELDSALKYYNKALAWDTKRSDFRSMGTRLRNIAIVKKEKGWFGAAITDLHQAIDFAREAGAITHVASANNSIGNIYLDQEDYEKAIDFFRNALEAYEKAGQPQRVAIAYNNLGLAYGSLGQIDSAALWLRKALSVHRELDLPQSRAHPLHNLGDLFLQQGQLDSAKVYLQESYELRRASQDQYGAASSALSLAAYHMDLGEFPEAIAFVKEAESYARVQNSRTLLARSLEFKNDLLSNLQNWKGAYDNLKEWAGLRDSLFNQEKLRVQEVMSAQQLQIKEEERKWEALLRNRAAQKADNNLAVAIALAVFLAFAFAAIAIIYRQRRKVALLNSRLQTQNKRIRLLSDQNLHFTRNALSELTGVLNIQSRRLNGPAKELMEGTRLRIETINLLYNQLFRSKSQEAEFVDLAELLPKIAHNTVESLLSSPEQVEVEIHMAEVEVSKEWALNFGLILNEITINACKYAFQQSSGHLKITLAHDSGAIILSAVDSGPGLPASVDPTTTTSFGLQLIRLLTEEMEGSIGFENMDPGLNIVVTIPVTQGAHVIENTDR